MVGQVQPTTLFTSSGGFAEDRGQLNLHLRLIRMTAGGVVAIPEVVTAEDIDRLVQRLDRIEASLALLVDRQAIKKWYSTQEVAHLLGKAEFTVREWCRLGRVRADKKGSGRGKYQSWVVSHAELQRVQREGLLPMKRG
jgi:hypothetical protein